MPFIIVVLIVIIIILCLKLKNARYTQSPSTQSQTTEEKVSDTIVAAIWTSVDLINEKIPLHSSALSDTILHAAFYRILSDVLGDFQLQDQFKNSYKKSLVVFSDRDVKLQRAAYEVFEKCQSDFAAQKINTFEDFEGFCASAFFLAHDYYDFDDYYDRAEKIYLDQISNVISALIELLESAYPNTATNNPIPKKNEAYFYLEAANGMMVRVPESKLESWQKAQDEIRNGTYKADPEEIQRIMDLGNTDIPSN